MKKLCAILAIIMLLSFIPYQSFAEKRYLSTKDGTCINADLNGSANIERKAFPELFTAGSVAFDNVKVYKYPDMAV